MQTLNYRTADESDLAQLQALGLLAYGQYKSIITQENWDKWEAAFKNDDTFLDLLKIATCFVCEVDDVIIGMAFFVPNGHPFLYFPAEWSYLRYIAVHPNYNGKGIGKKLTEHCIKAAKSKDEKTLALHTSEFQNAARHIYEQLGFIKQRELEPVFGKIFYIYTIEF